MKKSVIGQLYSEKYKKRPAHVCKHKIHDFLNQVLALIFPQMGKNQFANEHELEISLLSTANLLRYILHCLSSEKIQEEKNYEQFIKKFFEQLINIGHDLEKDAAFIAKEDPAATGVGEVILCYPGFYAIAVYRIAHYFYDKKIPLLPRIFSEYAHAKTGIDIHPGAKIEAPFFIDHGTGIVIGETTVIGKNCKIFQGVTLGALSVQKKFKNQKRHPTLEENCLVYSNTTILGGDTIIGKNTTIGGNVWITESLPKNSQVFKDHEFQVRPKKIR